MRGEPLARLRSRKGQWLLALLALRSGRALERSWLAETLWPESPVPKAQESLRTADQHIAEVALLQLPVRLAKALLRIADAEVAAVSRGTTGTVQLSQRELGNLVGAARETVNKCLREWQRSGLVRIEGTSITIADRATLQDVAEQT